MKVTRKGYLVWANEPWQREPEFYWREYKPSGSAERVCVGEMSITMDIPDDFDPRLAQVAALEAQKRELQAKFSAAVTELNRKINELMALEAA